MNLSGLVFALIAYSVIKFMIIGDILGQPTELDVPEFPTDFCPEFFTEGAEDNETNGETDDCEFKNPTCGNPIYLCIDYLGDVLYNFGIVVIVAFTFLFQMLTYVIQLIIFIGQLFVRALQPIEDTPWYINVLVLTPFTFLGALLIFKLITLQGDEE